MDPQQWLQNYQKKIDGIRRASEQLKENLGNSLVTMSSPDEAVTVTIGPNGSLKNLSLSPRATEHTPQQLGALIMTTVRRAQRQMAEKVVAAVSEFGGAEGDAAKLIRNYLPEDPSDQVAGQNENVSSFDQHLNEPQPEPPPARHAAPTATPVPAAAPVPQPASRPRAPRMDSSADDDGFEENPW
jgi:DNA-binding protein YbaB